MLKTFPKRKPLKNCNLLFKDILLKMHLSVFLVDESCAKILVPYIKACKIEAGTAEPMLLSLQALQMLSVLSQEHLLLSSG